MEDKFKGKFTGFYDSLGEPVNEGSIIRMNQLKFEYSCFGFKTPTWKSYKEAPERYDIKYYVVRFNVDREIFGIKEINNENDKFKLFLSQFLIPYVSSPYKVVGNIYNENDKIEYSK